MAAQCVLLLTCCVTMAGYNVLYFFGYYFIIIIILFYWLLLLLYYYVILLAISNDVLMAASGGFWYGMLYSYYCYYCVQWRGVIWPVAWLTTILFCNGVMHGYYNGYSSLRPISICVMACNGVMKEMA